MKFDTTQIRKDGLTEEIEVRLPRGEWDARLEVELQRLSERANIPGFRPGKAPRALLLRRFGEGLEKDVQNTLIQESLREIFTEGDVRPIRPPRIESAGLVESEGLVYRAIFERMPEIGPIDLGLFSFEALDLDEVPGDAIDGEVSALVRRNRPVKRLDSPRGALLGDLVLLHAEGMIEGVMHEGLSGPVQIVLGDGEYPADFEETVVGMDLGEEREIKMTLPESHGDALLAGKVAVVRVRLKEVFEVGEVPDVEALAKSLGLPDGHGLRGRVRANIADTAQRASDRVLRRAILDGLESHFTFELPGEALEDEYQGLLVAAEEQSRLQSDGGDGHDGHDHDHDHSRASANDNVDVNDNGGTAPASTPVVAAREVSQDEKDSLRKVAGRRLRLGVVLSEIARQNGLQVTAGEVEAAMRAESQRYPGQEGEALERMRKDPNFASDLRGPLLEEKVFRFIEKTAKLKRRSVSLEELHRAAQAAVSDAPPQPQPQPQSQSQS
ncbi:MAG: trigger factor [Alphaproteobacteria bacterium]